MVTGRMKLIRALESVINGDGGYVQSQLAKEDLARIKKLRALACKHDDYGAMEKEGLYIGWTQGDIRTHELSDELKHLMHGIYDYEKQGQSKQIDDKIMQYWADFHTNRLKVLVHCL